MTATELDPHDRIAVEACIRRAMLGDAAAFARLITAHYDRIYRLAYRCAGRREDAEDVAQEVSIKLAQNLTSYRFEAPFGAWLSRMVLNSARDMLRVRSRRQGRETPLFEDAEWLAGTDNPEQRTAARQTLALVDKLPEALRDTIILVFGEGMSHAEVATVLGCAETTISWRIHEARKQLQALQQQPVAEVKHGHA